MKAITLPSDQTVAPLGKVVVQEVSGGIQVSFTILMEPQGREAEGWRTGVALDASASMRGWYGRALEGKVPSDVIKDYESKGWVHNIEQDGRKVRSFEQQAYDYAIRQGFLKFSANLVEPLARDFVAYLAGSSDVGGTTTLLYWACGDGRVIEEAGSFTAAQCPLLQVKGPSSAVFGQGTHLLPALRHFIEKFSSAKRGMFLFVTDGRLDDLDEVVNYTIALARAIEGDGRNHVKCVLIGVGTGIDEAQMEILDNLDTGTAIDIWDHKIAREMRGLVEIFAEVVSDNHIVAPTAIVSDDRGQVVKKFTDGLPAKATVVLQPGSKAFTVEVSGRRITQPIAIESKT